MVGVVSREMMVSLNGLHNQYPHGRLGRDIEIWR